MRRVFLILGILLLAGCQQDVTRWYIVGDALLVNESHARVHGPFNLVVVPERENVRVDFVVDGLRRRSLANAPYALFENNTGFVSAHEIEVRIFAGRAPETLSIFLLGEPEASPVDLLRNAHFNDSLEGWHFYDDVPYVSWAPAGAEEQGAMRLDPNRGWAASTEAWQGTWDVHPGDTIVYSGWFRAGPTGVRRLNNGAGLGWDLRIAGDPTFRIIYTLNGPATLEREWTFIRTVHTIPCIGSTDKPIEQWTVSRGGSGTYMGARGGIWSDVVTRYLDKPLPPNLDLTVWVHVWHVDTAQWGEVDDLSLEIIPGSC